MTFAVFDVLSLIIIGVIVGIFLLLYIAIWRVEKLQFSHKIFYGVFFLPISILLFCGIFFQFIIDYLVGMVIYLLIAVQILLIMISETTGKETVNKIRIGRYIFYAFGFGIGIFGVLLLYIVQFYLMLFGISSLSEFNTANVIGIGFFGAIFFIFSLWGIAKEEVYGTGGKMKGSALSWANIILFIMSYGMIIVGLISILDLLFWNQHALQVYPNFNYIAGLLYFPIGIILFILSLLKLRRDYRYRRQFY